MIDEKKLIEDLKRLFSNYELTLPNTDSLEILNRTIEALQQPKADWIPCKVKDIIDTIISHNEIVALWYEEPTEDVRYDKQVWRGMAWDIPNVYKECKFIKIFGTVPESIVEADTINIRIELNEDYKVESSKSYKKDHLGEVNEMVEGGNSNENT